MFVGTVVSAASSRKQARLLLPRLPRLNPGITVVGAAVADAQAGESAASPAAKSGFMTRTSGMAGLTVEREARRDAAACGAERASSFGLWPTGSGPEPSCATMCWRQSGSLEDIKIQLLIHNFTTHKHTYRPKSAFSRLDRISSRESGAPADDASDTCPLAARCAA